MGEQTIGIGDIDGHVGRNINGFQGAHEGFHVGEGNQDGRLVLKCCNAKHLCIANTWFIKADEKDNLWLTM